MQDEVESSDALETERNILNLSDELLVHICCFLSSEDIVSLSRCCQRFNNILCERKLIRCVNLRAAYSLTPNILRTFFRPFIRCQHVTTVSLTSCYWLTSSEILWALQRLTNLKRLHANDTHLSIEHLTRVLKNNKSIESLSWTFHITKKIGMNKIQQLSEQLHGLKSFNLWTKGFAVFFVPVLLAKCSSLEELMLSFYKIRDIPWNYEPLSSELLNSKLCSPNMKSIVLNVPETGWIGLQTLLTKIIANNDANTWNCLWLDAKSESSRVFRFNCATKVEDLYAVCLTLQQADFVRVLSYKSLKYFVWDTRSYDINYDNLLGSSNITHLQWKNNIFPSFLPRDLQYLSISCYKMRMKLPCRSLITCDTLSQLTCLSVPACVLLAPVLGHYTPVIEVEEQDEASFQKEGRQSHIRITAVTYCFSRVLAEIAPNVQKLEIKCQQGCNTLVQDQLACLRLICWPQLESLFLENVPLIDLTSLVAVCISCPMLRRLGLRRVGINTEFSQTWNLVRALNVLHHLEDFQFEHPVVTQLLTIVDALSLRPKLRRVSIISVKTNTPQNLSSYLNLIEKCSQLVFLFVRVAAVTQKMEKDFQRELKVRFLSSRKSLWASLEGTDKDNFWESMPSVHCYEMIVNPALMASIPPLKD